MSCDAYVERLLQGVYKHSTLRQFNTARDSDQWIARQIVEYYREKEKEHSEKPWPRELCIIHKRHGPKPIFVAVEEGDLPAAYVYHDGWRYHGIRSLNVN